MVNHYADAPDRPKGARHFDLARQLVEHGDRVTIFAAGFSHLTGREERLGHGRMYRRMAFQGVDFVWLWTFPYRGNTWRRQVNMLSFVVTFLVVQTRIARPDVVIGSTVHPFAALAGWVAARLRGGRFLFEVRDLWPQTLVDLGAMRVGSPGERLLRGIEAFLVRRAVAVITLLPGMADYLREQGLPADRVVYIPNGVDLEVFDVTGETGVTATGEATQVSGPGRSAGDDGSAHQLAVSLAAADRMRAEGRLVIGYVGSFGRVNQVGVILEAAMIAERRAPGRIGLLLVGDGPELSDLRREAAPAGDAIVFGPAVPRRSVATILRAIDVAVVHATATPVYRYGISFNKLFEYMAAGRPVAFACASAYDPVAATGAGISVQPDDPEALAGAFLALADAGPVARARMGAAGRAYVEAEHNIERLGETLAEVIATAAGDAED